MKYKTTYNKCFIINAMCKKHIHKEIKVHFLNANQKLIIPNNSRNFPSKRLKFEEQNIFTIQKVSKQNSCSGNAYFRLLYFFFSIYSSFNTNLTGNETAFNQLIDPFVVLSQLWLGVYK